MKENNKFSLSAFFCSLGSKSKIFMLFLLGAPFLLVQIFTLKVYANSAVIPVVPDGLTSSGIGSSGVVPGDPTLMYYTLLIALGLKANEVYQINKADLIDSVTEAFNEYDSVNDPTLGDDLETFLEWYDNAKSQNGYINELSISRNMWDRLNKATSNGLNIRIPSNNTSISFSSNDDLNNYINSFGYNVSSNVTGGFYYYYTQNNSFYAYSMVDYTSGDTFYLFLTGASCVVNLDQNYGVNVSFQLLDNQNFSAIYARSNGGTVSDYYDTGSLNLLVSQYNILSSSSNISINKSIGVARPFISSKANGTYDVLSKSGLINDQTGNLEGDVTMSILSYDKIKDIASDYEDSATDIPVFFPDSRLVPIDIENPDAIPDSVGIPGDTPQEIVDSLADTFDPSPAEPIVIEPFNYIDQWDPVIPIAAESPLVGLPFVMNWVAEQMQITMFLSQFSNTWLVLSTLAVASCLVGLVRIWR